MRRFERFLTGFLVFCSCFQVCAVSCLAEEETPYTYTVTFYAGNQGVFAGTEGIRVTDEQGALADGVVKTSGADASAVTVSGLRAGYRVTFSNIQDDGVNLRTDGPYYVRGLRRSGHDNDTVDAPSFRVEQDQDYVVAYGIQGEQVSYVIRYEDTDGNCLSTDRVCFGNVGDRPAVAFLYIEGYRPLVCNLTGTLSENEAENVFVFVYARTGGASTGGREAPGGVSAAFSSAAALSASVDTDSKTAETATTDGRSSDVSDRVPTLDENVPKIEDADEIWNLDDRDEKTPLIDMAEIFPENRANILGAAIVGATAAAALIVLTVQTFRKG